MNESSMSIGFLGWDRPALHEAVPRLEAWSSRPDELDLSRVAVVLPGARAGRVLLSLLTQRTAASPIPFSPPTIATPGEIPELVLGSNPRVAGDVATLMAWVTALKGLAPETFRALAGDPPPLDELSRWLGLAEMLVGCEAQLAAAGRTMGDVAAAADDFGPGFATERWDAAAAAQAARDAVLESNGLIERHKARRDALRANSHPTRAFDRLVLLGMAELPPIAKEAIIASGIPTTVMVHGREIERDMLDDWGMPRADSAELLDVRLGRELIVFAESPRDQAHEALAAALKNEPSCDETTLCLADESLASVTERVAADAGVAVHHAAGTTLQRSRVWRLVAAIRRHMTEGTIESLRALLRQSDIERSLGISSGLLAKLDEYAEQTLHQSLGEPWRTESGRNTRAFEDVHRRLDELLDDLNDAQGGDAADELLKLLATVLGHDDAHPADLRPADRRAFKAFRDVVDRVRTPDSRPMLAGVGSVHVLGLILRSASRVTVPDEAAEPALEVIGWLEAAMDPAARLTVSGFNEGAVPAAVGADPLLTESMRSVLSLPNATTRLARDAWLLRTLVGSKQALRLVCGRRSAEGDPIRPSRFLLTAAPEELPNRVLEAMGKIRGQAATRVEVRAKVAGSAAFVVPAMPREPVRHKDTFSVTSFRTYIESPYQFYLKHVLRLDEATTPGREASAATFGNLIHRVLKTFAQDESLRLVTDPHRIEAAMLAGLEHEARTTFGDRSSPAAMLQVEIARRRLRALAAWQAARTSEGWIIAHAEWSPPTKTIEFMVDDRAARISGSIDRIDRHAATGQLAILDFKTGDTPRKASDAYKAKTGRWLDLQLPLYRHLAASLGADDGSVLGYMNIGPDAGSIELVKAAWDPDDLRNADETATEVIRLVREGRFEDTGTIGEFNPIHAAMAGQGFGTDDEGEE